LQRSGVKQEFLKPEKPDRVGGLQKKSFAKSQSGNLPDKTTVRKDSLFFRVKKLKKWHDRKEIFLDT
jgi:hypothetical protein